MIMERDERKEGDKQPNVVATGIWNREAGGITQRSEFKKVDKLETRPFKGREYKLFLTTNDKNMANRIPR